MSKKIMIVDDDVGLVKTVDALLKTHGFETVIVNDGMQAVNSIKAENPDLIVLDVMMPKLDGFNVCRMIKFDEKLSNIPIIMLTSRADETDKSMGEEVKVDAYLTKPLEAEKLLSEVKRLLEL